MIFAAISKAYPLVCQEMSLREDHGYITDLLYMAKNFIAKPATGHDGCGANMAFSMADRKASEENGHFLANAGNCQMFTWI